MAYYLLLAILLFAALTSVDGTGSSCDDIDSQACAQMGKENPNLCSETIISMSACPKFCGNCPTACYNCNTTHFDRSACNTVTCNKDEICMVKTIKSSRNGHTNYMLGCATSTYCATGSKREIRSRSLSIDCCNNDLCNMPQTTPATTTTTALTTTAAPDPCISNPCVFGTCSTSSDSFRCTCDHGYTGRICDTFHDPCHSSPCKFGTCSQSGSSFTCTCNHGYTGHTCDTSFSNCVPDPCLHGFCSDLGSSYKCTCDHGYNGTNCNIKDPCQLLPCKHGVCNSTSNGATSCTCNAGYTGFYCDIPNPCSPNPCIHGLCLKYGTTFQCHCSNGYYGHHCEKTSSPCASNPCVHGTCTHIGHSYKCSCNYGYVGLRCDAECKRDVILLLDSKFNRNGNTKGFLSSFFNNTETIGINGIQIALAYYDTQVHSIWELNTHTDKRSLLHDLYYLNLPKSNVTSDFSIAVYHLLQKYYGIKLATGASGERPRVPDVAVIMTGSTTGYRYSQNNIRHQLLLLKSLNVSTIVFGIGDAVDHSVTQDFDHSIYNSDNYAFDGFYFGKQVLSLVCG
ncbi:neurogenic locus notch homolog protein 1-like [Ruditapes philippinarum]|uniref:neurogenic locus notch homolog protein 1-like n=1 Tax=Ruditapes philippinarum TaxID=129788 RepID=UPI00295A7CA8|nr:neurogenic locus notch homolog protein 1-like [Ruditapes philippinarum]